MSTFTKEQLIEHIKGRKEFAEECAADSTLHPERREYYELTAASLRIALASLEAEAVAYMYKDNLHSDARFSLHTRFGNWSQEDINEYEITEIPLYTVPPSPVSVPDELTREEYKRRFMEVDNFDDTFRGGWNACRDAMLQGAESNSPVIPDGWVMVPVEPTEDMIVHGFESEPDESFSDEKEWEAYVTMSGCQQAAHRAKLCWAAMITAAPKPDVR